MKKGIVPAYIIYLFFFSLLLLIIFNVCRLILLFQNKFLIVDAPTGEILYALFNRGLLFDTSIIAYTIAPVFLILSIGGLANIKSIHYSKATGILVFIISSISLLFACADIPYFHYYNSRLTKTVLVLSANDSIWLILYDMFTNPNYLPYTLLFIAGVITIGITIKKLNKKVLLLPDNEMKWYIKLIYFLVGGFLIFSGLRGDINPDALPLKLEHAYFTENTVINQIGLNPTFSFIESYKESDLKFMKDDEALKNVRSYFNINEEYDSPIARKVNGIDTSTHPNIILILVESLSSAKIGSYGYKHDLMPFIDSMADHGIVFRNTYTAGMHTHNGIFSSLTGLPAILNNTPMLNSNTTTQSFAGLGTVLKSYDYNSIFFMSGKKNFDNMQGFLPINGFDELVSKMDYPEDQWINRWGVPDHCIFDKAVPKLDSLAMLPEPFFGTFMTISTHNPYSVPKNINFTSITSDLVDRSYEYADWSIKQFVNELKNKSWFNNTIFVVIGDHGQNFNTVYDIPLSYHHTPMIFYAPELIQPARYEKLALQIDLFPTLMGIINLPFVNNTLGVNLLTDSRPFAYFSTDDKIGCLNEEYYLIVNPKGTDALYRYKDKSVTDLLDEHKELVFEMKKYTYSMLQTAQWMINHRKTGPLSDKLVEQKTNNGE